VAAAVLNQPLAAARSAESTPEVFARLSIPKIHLDAIVLEGVSKRELSVGPAHMAGTGLPGQAGNTVIMAHRDTFFRHIIELGQGDEIILEKNGRLFHYQVTGKKIVQPREVSVLDPTDDAVLTLITCYPIYYVGPAPKRLVVVSKLTA
jgi:sortase A